METRSKYATPNEFIQAHLEYRLKDFETQAIKMEESEREARESWVKSVGSLRNWISFYNPEFYWKCAEDARNELNNFIEGRYKQTLDEQLWSRLAVSGFMIDPSNSVPNYSQEEQSMFQCLEAIQEYYDYLVVKIESTFTNAVVTVESCLLTHRRRSVRRHADYWAYFNEDADDNQIDIPGYTDIFEHQICIALLRALIAAYDHGLWGKSL